KLRVADAGALLTGALPQLQTSLASAAELADATNGNPAKFDRFVGPDTRPANGAKAEFASVSLWRAGSIAAGPLTHVGVPPRLPTTTAVSFLGGARRGVLSVMGLLKSPPLGLGYAYATGGYVVYAESLLPPRRHAAIQKRSAFTGLNDAIYLGRSQRPQDLLTTNVSHLPLTGDTASVIVPFGDNWLTLVMSSRISLAGALPRDLPWIIAILGTLLSAAAATLTLRLLQERDAAERFAQRLEVSAAENRRLYAEQRTIAQTLQHALLPSTLPQTLDLQTSARYAPGERGIEVGGDWYDVIDVGEERMLLVVGDVSGRGLRAATTMAALRYAIRAYATQGDSPPTILTKLSRLVSVAEGGQLATVLCVLIDPARRVLSLASAGHLPPLLIGDSAGGRYLQAELGVPIGVEPGVAYGVREMPLPEAGTLLAFTDGLVETRSESIDEGLERMRAAAEARADLDLEDLVTRLVSEVPGGGTEDDIAIVGVRWGT
ncbi:MAG TPA: PP2C family protein-serine/threonine phosphatase, partial [Solirubrobacteraceae bacterium]|nr:PP2C family protein-serine/threonine phosphatase [Solirubrobacteraceae bacterium]